MKILIADDDPFVRKLLASKLAKWEHAVYAVASRSEAWAYFSRTDEPCLAILDWLMPGIDGPEVCRLVRSFRPDAAIYLLLLTANSERSDKVEGLAAGANDYVTKPFNEAELYARVQVGMRMLELQQQLAGRIEQLSVALARIRKLEGLLPICTYCKSIRNDLNYWQTVEHYICEHADVAFTHGVCPGCLETLLRSAKPDCAASA